MEIHLRLQASPYTCLVRNPASEKIATKFKLNLSEMPGNA